MSRSGPRLVSKKEDQAPPAPPVISVLKAPPVVAQKPVDEGLEARITKIENTILLFNMYVHNNFATKEEQSAFASVVANSLVNQGSIICRLVADKEKCEELVNNFQNGMGYLGEDNTAE